MASKSSINNIAQAIYASSLNKDEAGQDAIIKSTITLLKTKNMLGKSKLLLTSLEKIIDKEEGIANVKISSRSKLTPKIVEEIEEFIKKRYGAKNVVMNFTEDEKLLGGIRLQIGDEIIDTTLIRKTQRLQNYLITN